MSNRNNNTANLPQNISPALVEKLIAQQTQETTTTNSAFRRRGDRGHRHWGEARWGDSHESRCYDFCCSGRDLPGLRGDEMITVFDVADYFLHVADMDDGDEGITNLKLQKLVYYAQGFHLALYGSPLFSDEIVAWQHGPVVVALYEKYKEFRKSPIDPPTSGIWETFSQDIKELLPTSSRSSPRLTTVATVSDGHVWTALQPAVGVVHRRIDLRMQNRDISQSQKSIQLRLIPIVLGENLAGMLRATIAVTVDRRDRPVVVLLSNTGMGRHGLNSFVRNSQLIDEVIDEGDSPAAPPIAGVVHIENQLMSRARPPPPFTHRVMRVLDIGRRNSAQPNKLWPEPRPHRFGRRVSSDRQMMSTTERWSDEPTTQLRVSARAFVEILVAH